MIRRITVYYSIVLTMLGLALAGTPEARPSEARAAVNLSASTFSVTNTSDSGPGSLREAISDANANPGTDTINITAQGTLLLLSPLPVISDSLTIQGPGADLFIVDGNNSSRVFEIDNTDVTIIALTVQHGMVSGTTEYGAGIRSTGTLSLEGVEVVENTAQSHGAGIYASGSLTITGGGIRNNVSTNGVGGGLRSTGITIISGTQFIGNTSQGDGGGAFVLSELVLTNVLFQDNRCTASSCDGGGLFSFSNTTIDGSQFISNIAQDQAGGVAAPGDLAITASLFQNNQAVFGTGGGLFAQNSVTVQETQFLENTSRGSGGGIYALAAAEMSNVLFESNQSTLGTGGGLHASGNLNLTRAQFLRNTAQEGGGVAHTLNEGSLVNVLFAENAATNTTGMAMLLASTGPVEVLHVTIAGPSAASGSAIEAAAGSSVVTNTIITNHSVGIDNTGASVQQDYNLFFGNGTDTQGSISGGTNSRSGDPIFVDPAMDDYHIGPGSAAHDVGTNAGVVTDFEGDSRPMGAGFDIGFDEMEQIEQPPDADQIITFLPIIYK